MVFNFRTSFIVSSGTSRSLRHGQNGFICPRGMYRFRTMPFGLCNAGATFQRLMDIIMYGLNLTVRLSYSDDIVVFSKTSEEHLDRPENILQRLRESGLKLKPGKCCLFRKSVSFLGHIKSEDGTGTDPQKTQPVSEWPAPECVKDCPASGWRSLLTHNSCICSLSRENQNG